MTMLFSRYAAGFALCGTLCLTPLATVSAQDAGDAVQATEQQRRVDARSQDRIDQLDDATREALQAYRAVVWETQQLTVYAEQLQELIDQQADELESLQAQIDELQITEREIMPLMLRMVDALERFIALDLPFLQEEREERVAALRDALGDPSVSVADRYQKVLEAYAKESDYGRGIGHERAEIDGRVHDLLRIGRVALYALSLDGSEVKRWNAQQDAWEPLPGHFAPTVRTGLRMSRETIAPELMLLPVQVPKAQAASAQPRAVSLSEDGADGDADPDTAEDTP